MRQHQNPMSRKSWIPQICGLVLWPEFWTSTWNILFCSLMVPARQNQKNHPHWHLTKSANFARMHIKFCFLFNSWHRPFESFVSSFLPQKANVNATSRTVQHVTCSVDPQTDVIRSNRIVIFLGLISDWQRQLQKVFILCFCPVFFGKDFSTNSHNVTSGEFQTQRVYQRRWHQQAWSVWWNCFAIVIHQSHGFLKTLRPIASKFKAACLSVFISNNWEPQSC